MYLFFFTLLAAIRYGKGVMYVKQGIAFYKLALRPGSSA